MDSIEYVNDNTPIGELYPLIAIRTVNCLLRVGYRTMGDIRNLTEDDVMKCRNAGRKTVEDAMRFITKYNERYGESKSESKSENLIYAAKLIDYCKKMADVSQELADKALANIGHGESEQSALGACAFFSTQAKMYRYDIPEVIRGFLDTENGGADNEIN